MAMKANIHSRAMFGNTSEKKCPHCGKWTSWTMQAEDTCQHCHRLLSTHIREKEERAEKIRNAPSGLFPVNPADGTWLKIGKRTVNFGHMLFTAFMSFVVWLITFVAG